MKYILLCLLISAAAIAQAQTRTQYKVGDSAFCGIVFRVEPLDTLGSQRVLICSLKDQAVSVAWYNGQFVSTSAVKDILFDKANADRIINVQGQGNNAASICFNVPLQDSSCLIRDTLWYLPSRAELTLIYQSLDSMSLVKFAKEGYWTSVEFTDGTLTRKKVEKKAWIVDFFNGKSFPVNKSNKYHVRAIREFRN